MIESTTESKSRLRDVSVIVVRSLMEFNFEWTVNNEIESVSSKQFIVE